MQPGGFDDALRGQLEDVRKELADLRNAIRGNADYGIQGVFVRIDTSEKRIAELKEIQDQFMRERKSEYELRERRDKARNRIQAIVLTVLTGVMSGILVQLFTLISHVGHP